MAVRVLSEGTNLGRLNDLTAMLQLGVVKRPGPPKIVAVFQRVAGRRRGK